MAAAQGAKGLIYHGYRRQSSGQVVMVESGDREPIGVLNHVVLHSPSGLNWGYHGSGPSDTAFNLMGDAMGAAALCPVCAGTGRVVYLADGDLQRAEPFYAQRHTWSKRGWPCQCADGYRQLPVREFVDEFVAHWPDEWVISQAAILNWLATRISAAADRADDQGSNG